MNRLSIMGIVVSLIIGIGGGYAYSYGEIAGLQSENTSLGSEISTLTTDYVDLNTTYDQLSTDYSNLNVMYNQLQTACNNLNGTYNQLLEDYCSLESEYNSLNSNCSELATKYNTLNSSHNELLTQYNILQGNYGSLNLTYQELQSDYEEALDRIAELEQMIDYEVNVLLDYEYYYSVKNDLQNANETISVAMYSMIYDPDDTFDWANDLIRELVYAKDRGVNVTVIIEYRTYWQNETDNLEAYDYLSNNGVNVLLDEDTETDHMKFVLIDDDLLYVGSHNWSESGLYYNRETSVKIVSEEIADIFKAYFKTIICPVC